MTRLFIVSKAKRERMKKALAFFLTLSINLTMGGVMALIPTTVAYAAPLGLFGEGFEANNFLNWDIHNSDWVRINNASGAQGGSFRASVTGPSSNELLQKNLSTVGYTGIDVDFWYKADQALETGDTVKLQWSNDGGSNWTDAHTIDKNNDNSSWTHVTTSLPAGANNAANFRVRFNANTNGSTDQVSIDNFNVSGTADIVAPDTTITSGPTGTVSSASATFAFTATEANSTFKCKLDTEAEASCTSTKTYSGLAQGSHTFSVYATDPAGNPDTSRASRTWTVDTVPPTVTISSPLTGATTLATGVVLYSVGDASHVSCTLDGHAVSCDTSGSYHYSNLSDSHHTFSVTGTDVAGNSTHDSVTWIVDTSVSLKVRKIVINNDGAHKDADDFHLWVKKGNSTIDNFHGSFLGHDVENDNHDLTSGSYTVGESNENGYHGTVGGDCAADGSVTLNPGDHKTCAITNDDTVPENTLARCTDGRDNDGDGLVDLADSDCAQFMPQITVIKHVSGGNQPASFFDIFVKLTDEPFATVATVHGSELGSTVSVNPGSYNVQEDGYANYNTSYSATGCNPRNLHAGDHVTCTVTNTYVPPVGTLTVNKVVVGGTKTVSDFVLKVCPTTSPVLTLLDNMGLVGVANAVAIDPCVTVTSGTTNTLAPGWYQVTEVNPEDWHYHMDRTAGYCNSDGKVYVGSGEAKMCEMTNTYVPPQVCPEGTTGTYPECTPIPPQSCEQDISTLTRASNTSDVHVGSALGPTAVGVSPIHPAWTTLIPGAVWIWGENPVSPVTDETGNLTESFFDVFQVVGTPTGGSLDIAADNSFDVFLNGNPVYSDNTGVTFGGSQHVVLLGSDFEVGSNTLEVRVKNWGAGNMPSNPAGLLYKLTINKNACEPTPAPVCNPDVNLLENAGFEAPGAPTVPAGGWAIVPFTDPLLKWLGNWVVPHDDASPLGLEIQAGVAGTPAEGSHLAELDGYHPTAIYQNVPTISGYDYELSFKYSPRPGTALGNNVLEVRKDGAVLGAQISRGSTAGDTQWSTEYRTFQGTGAATKIEFADVSATDDSLGTYLDGMNLSCVGPHVPKTTIVATKVVCANESDLPNWSGTGRTIDANSAADYVAAHEACHLESGWQFQWGPTATAGDPGDAYVGEATDGGWTTFGPTNASGVASTVITNGDMSSVWMREVLKDGYIPFTYHSTNGDVSAEMYCNGDVLNYDNLDYAQLGDGATTYCVAFNAPKPVVETPKGHVVIVKHTVGGDGEFNFTLNHGEDSTIHASVATENGEGTAETIDVTPDTNYTVDESVPEGWDFTSQDCKYDDESTGNVVEQHPTQHVINVEAGETVTCTYTNTKRVVTPPQQTCQIEGYKYDAEGNPVAGLAVGVSSAPSVFNDAFEGEQGQQVRKGQLIVTKTVESGHYCLNSLPGGTVRVFEWPGAGTMNDHVTVDGENANARINSFFDVFTEIAITPSTQQPAQINSFFDVFTEINGGAKNAIHSFFDVFTELSLNGAGAPANSFFDVFTELSVNGEGGGHHVVNFYNKPIPSVTPPGGGGSSTFDYFGCTNPAATNFNPLANKDDGSCQVPGGNGGGNPPGEVLGAATTAPDLPLPAACLAHPYLRDYLKMGKKNDPEQVKLLQSFLNDKMGANLPVNGYFGPLTRMWVKKFQKAHMAEILQPWIDAGFDVAGLKDGTGYVYKTTKRFINIMMCAELNEPMPDLTPDTN